MLKVTISNEQGEVYVIADVTEARIARYPDEVLLSDEESDLITANQLILDAIIWDEVNSK